MMRIRSGPASMRVIGLMSVALLLAAGRARADDKISVGFDTSVPTANITYSSDNSGGTHTENAYVGAFINITDSQNPGALPSSTGFCIDLWHNLSGGQSFQGATSSATNIASQPGWFPYPNFTPRESDPVFTNQLNYLGAVYTSLKGLSGGAANDAIGAVQLGIWYLTDKHFGVSAVGNDPHGNLLSDFGTSTTGVVGLLNGHNETIEGLTLAGYSSSQAGTYPVGTLVTVDRNVRGQSDQYQNLIMWGGNASLSTAPEPSTMTIGGLGALAFLGYGLRRRKASGA